jgi:hypothetical protein
MSERVVDVSDLEPPEPLVLTLAAVDDLTPGGFVRMLHRREPCLLPDNLRRRGFRFVQRPGLQTAVEVFIWREGDAAAEQAVQHVLAADPR